jgi:uncharacterized protein YbcI
MDSGERVLRGGELLTAISNAMVALHREHFGRGAGSAKSFFVDGMILTVLTDIYTPVEKTLIRAGKEDHVRDTRQMHQLALDAEYREPVERLTRRRVTGFVSTVNFDPDMAVELFVLEPE